MKIDEKIKQRFFELAKQVDEIEGTKKESKYEFPSIDHCLFINWLVKVKSLISGVCGENSQYFKKIEIYEKPHHTKTEYDSFTELKAVFLAIKYDYENGYMVQLANVISGEVLGDFVNLAKASLAEGHKDVAAVLACAAFEDCMKKYAVINDIDVTNKVIQDIVNALKAKGLVSGAKKALLEVIPKIRDYAMHANWNMIQIADVNSVIGYVEGFLLEHFS